MYSSYPFACIIYFIYLFYCLDRTSILSLSFEIAFFCVLVLGATEFINTVEIENISKTVPVQHIALAYAALDH